MEAKTLRTYLDRLLAHAGDDPTRPRLCGALVEPDGRTVATSGTRLLDLGPGSCLIDRFDGTQLREMFLPRAWLEAARHALTGVDGHVKCEMRERGSRHEAAVTRIELWPGDAGLCISASAEFADRFPQWRQVVPAPDRPGGLRARVSRRDLVGLARGAARGDAPARLTLNDGGLYLAVEAAEGARERWRGIGSAPIRGEDGKPIDATARPLGGAERVTHLQASYLVDAITGAPDAAICVDIDAEELAPIAIYGDGWRSVVMPRRY